MARAAGALAEEGLTHNTPGVAYVDGGDPERGLAHYGEALRIAREVGDPATASRWRSTTAPTC